MKMIGLSHLKSDCERYLQKSFHYESYFHCFKFVNVLDYCFQNYLGKSFEQLNCLYFCCHCSSVQLFQGSIYLLHFYLESQFYSHFEFIFFLQSLINFIFIASFDLKAQDLMLQIEMNLIINYLLDMIPMLIDITVIFQRSQVTLQASVYICKVDQSTYSDNIHVSVNLKLYHYSICFHYSYNYQTSLFIKISSPFLSKILCQLFLKSVSSKAFIQSYFFF